ncbi:uncharacterized protein [Osmerus mordax]|uniref:uncharacterized protein n=1 Tax=Osmerus mordax TaxID=8014 RepID=UPI003510307A
MRVLDSVKAAVHGASSFATGYFCYLIVVTVRHTQELRSKASFLLLCQHCTCIAAFNAAGCILHSVRASRVPAPRLFCWLVFDLQVVAARGAMMNLTLMALNACLSVLQPLHYRALVRCIQRPVMVVVWLLALLSPVLFTALAGARLGWEGALALDEECSTALEGWAPRLSSLVLLGLLVLLILLSNALLAMESYRAGHFTRSNRRVRRTALIHVLQMSFHILPCVVIISRVRLGLLARVLNFLVFSVAQSASPVVYGLRCRDLWDYLPRFLPGWALRLRSWYHTLSAGNSTGNSTGKSPSNSSSNNTNLGPVTDTTLISRSSDDSTDVIHVMKFNAGEEALGGRDSTGPEPVQARPALGACQEGPVSSTQGAGECFVSQDELVLAWF